MSSDEVKVIYHSEHRTVVSGYGLVLQMSGDAGWVRRSGTGGPMHGELISTCKDGVWSPELDLQAIELVAAANTEK
jgi:hypothetical protein